MFGNYTDPWSHTPGGGLVGYDSDSDDDNSDERSNDQVQTIPNSNSIDVHLLDTGRLPTNVSNDSSDCKLVDRDDSSLAVDEQDFEEASFTSRIPPRPRGTCSSKLLAKFEIFLKKQEQGICSLNEQLRKSKHFRNPDILEWLVDNCGIDEIGSNYPRSLYDPHGFDVDIDFADALARVQSDAYRLKRDSLEGKRDKIEFVTTFVTPLSNEESTNKRPRL